MAVRVAARLRTWLMSMVGTVTTAFCDGVLFVGLFGEAVVREKL